jgi:aminopeptidase N
MKINTYLLLSFLSLSAMAQQARPGFDNLVEAEMKSAYNISNFRANLNTGNYDVTYQKLELAVNPGVQFVSGSITTTFTALQNMATLTFDLSNNLDVSSVTRNGLSLAYSQNNNDELIITLPTVQNAGTSGTVTVNYSGTPFDEEDSFVSSEHNGVPIIWTLSEPYGAKEWWPCKQDLNDKINSIDVYITAPSQYVSVSNGLEQSQQLNSNGTKTTHFHHNYPIPAYLVAIAVTNYTIYTQQAGTAPNTFPVVNYLYPEQAPNSQLLLEDTVPIMNFYESLFETYPFHTEKYGHAQCGFGGGMEHTTVSFMGYFGRELIAHELAHQWFGDKITCGSWKDIWLNEGFATYLTGLVSEELEGEQSFMDWRTGLVESITSQAGGAVYLTDADTLNVNRIFSSRLTYNKGAMVLHMLRLKIGADTFFQGVRNYLADADLAYDYAKTPDFQAHLEAASGTDLDEFFADWIYNQGYPSYHIDVVSPNFGESVITLTQTQSHPSVSYFEGPVPIRLTDTSGTIYDVVLDNTFNGQQFTLPVPFMVAGAEVNATKDIISINNTATVSAPVFSLLSGMRLYPNPASGMLRLDVPPGVVVEQATFYNALGQKVLQTRTQTAWDVAPLATGLHFITVVTAQGTAQLKFIKE